MKLINVLVVVTALLFGQAQVFACSAFMTPTAEGRIVGKNFDWFNGDGHLTINQRGRHRTGFVSDKRWIATYGSVTLSVFGPDLPISGMNEKGLVVETLVNSDSQLPARPSDQLVTLEFVQYQLDNHERVSEVVAYAEESGFQQIVKPVHFFVCDTTGACAVIETDGTDTVVFAGDDMPINVLANNNYESDLRSYWTGLRHVYNVVTPRSASHNRFATLVAAVENRDAWTGTGVVDNAFTALDRAKIPSLSKWQIVWNLDEKKVHWRDDFDRSRRHTIAFSQLDFSCSGGTQIRGVGALQSSIPAFRSFNSRDSIGVKGRVRGILSVYGGQESDRFAEKITRHVNHSTCRTWPQL